MLVFHSHCQMGNQMFIYACARSLARAKGEKYCLSEIDHLKYFELGEEDRNNSFKYKMFKFQNKLPLQKYLFRHYQDNRVDYSKDMLKEITNRVWYYGYFQGEQYFYNNHEDIRKCFSIKKEYVERFNNASDGINLANKKTAVIHIRLKDYKTFGPEFLKGPDLSLPFEYYHKLIKQLKLKDDHRIIFLSDEIDVVKKEFSYLADAYFSTHDFITDFQIIKNADIALIAHSSFGWWASWLNERPGKQIYLPKYFLGFKVHKEFPVNMIPAQWNQVNVPGY